MKLLYIAYGDAWIEDDLDEDGNAITLNIRFPGQYFDLETEMHYNYFRDYAPGLGRYVQSDPIGLEGGLNTYGYVKNSPVQSIDIYGLQPDEYGMPGTQTGPSSTTADVLELFNTTSTALCNFVSTFDIKDINQEIETFSQNVSECETVYWQVSYLRTHAGCARDFSLAIGTQKHQVWTPIVGSTLRGSWSFHRGKLKGKKVD